MSLEDEHLVLKSAHSELQKAHEDLTSKHSDLEARYLKLERCKTRELLKQIQRENAERHKSWNLNHKV